MYQHQPRVGFDTQALDPFVFDPMRSVKCEWEITDGKHFAVGECKSILRNFAKAIRGVMGGVANNGLESLVDIGGVSRPVGFQTQAGCYDAWRYNQNQNSLIRSPGIHVGSGSSAVLHTDSALAAETANNLTGAPTYSTENSSTIIAVPVNNSTEFQFTMSATFTPAANGTINEIGLSTRMAHTAVSGGLPPWQASTGRFMMVRDTVAGFALTAGVSYTVKFTFRFLPTSTSFFTVAGAVMFGLILSDQFNGAYANYGWNRASISNLSQLPNFAYGARTFIGVGEDSAAFSMSDFGVTTGLQLAGFPAIAEIIADTSKLRWTATQSNTFAAAKTIKSACLAVTTAPSQYAYALAIAKLPAPVPVAAGNSQAFQFTFEIAV